MRYLNLRAKIRDIRMLSIIGIAEAGSGHPGASFSAAEIMGSLYFRIMKHNPSNPEWPERDYFINSKAHSAPGYYATLSVAGYFPTDEMRSLRKLGSRLQGHPIRYSVYQQEQSVPGIEYSGGSEGIGLSVAVGIALASKTDGKKNHVYVLIGDGESDEGQIWEAAMAASKFKLDNITVILDRNRIQQDGFTEDIMPLDPLRDKWAAFNWSTEEVNGHNVEQMIDAFNKTNQVKDRPSIIIANTIKGNGIKHMTNNPQWHGKAPPRKHTPLLLEELENECLIAPSIIAGEPENYEDKIKKAERGGADMIHLDIMDGKFVNNITMNAETIKKLRHITSLPFDAHLMIENPLRHIDKFIEARCDIITVHAEACKDEKYFKKITDKLISNGVSPGLAINPDTTLPKWVYNYLDCIDVMIIMSVNPGFAGQKFIPSVLSKMENIIPHLRNNGYKGYFEGDGGIDLSTISSCYKAGCRIFVMGNAIFGSENIIDSIKNAKFLLNSTLEKELLLQSDSLDIREDWIKNRKDILKRFNVVEEICK
jgi:transketolase